MKSNLISSKKTYYVLLISLFLPTIFILFQNCSENKLNFEVMASAGLPLIEQVSQDEIAIPICSTPPAEIILKMRKDLFGSGLCTDSSIIAESIMPDSLEKPLCEQGPTLHGLPPTINVEGPCAKMTVCGKAPLEVDEASDPAAILLRYEVVYGCRARIKSKMDVSAKESSDEPFTWQKEFATPLCRPCQAVGAQGTCGKCPVPVVKPNLLWVGASSLVVGPSDKVNANVLQTKKPLGGGKVSISLPQLSKTVASSLQDNTYALCSPQAYFNSISDFNVDLITKYTFQCVPANGSVCSSEQLAKLQDSSFEIFDVKNPNVSLIDGGVGVQGSMVNVQAKIQFQAKLDQVNYGPDQISLKLSEKVADDFVFEESDGQVDFVYSNQLSKGDYFRGMSCPAPEIVSYDLTLGGSGTGVGVFVIDASVDSDPSWQCSYVNPNGCKKRIKRNSSVRLQAQSSNTLNGEFLNWQLKLPSGQVTNCNSSTNVCQFSMTGPTEVTAQFQAKRYEWQAGQWTEPKNTWVLGSSTCNVSCGQGRYEASYSCPSQNQTRTRTYFCSDGQQAVDSTRCSTPKHADESQQFLQTQCEGANPGPVYGSTCNLPACVVCPATTLTANTWEFTAGRPGTTCTDTVPTSLSGTTLYSHRTNGPGYGLCRGSGCRTLNQCDEPNSANYYKGTITSPEYGICENYCAVRATCKSDGTWQVVGFTW